ncbi:hypothetical protein IFM89_009087 [Coptis chinensis]|uniref:Uncharacterized protein n=1 Tax=Coptis chinensis TaxID=261450 RepID=A0A835IIU3_9MAGN|nr:hypothetical protein IFM89_009087 [Coptis chinensis]
MARVSRFILGIIVRSIEKKVLLNKDCNSNIRQDESFSISLFISRTRCKCGRCSWSTSDGVLPVPLQLVGLIAIKLWMQQWLVVKQIIKSFRWAPFLPVATDNSMLSVLLLLSKYRLRSVPIIEIGNPFVKNFNTQSAVVQGLQKCKGRDCLITLQVTQYLILDFLLRRMRR